MKILYQILYLKLTMERKKPGKISINDILEEIEVSPVKLNSISSHSRMSYGKRKPKQVFTKLEEKMQKFNTK